MRFEVAWPKRGRDLPSSSIPGRLEGVGRWERESGYARARRRWGAHFVRVPGTSDVRPAAALWDACAPVLRARAHRTRSRSLGERARSHHNAIIVEVVVFSSLRNFKGNQDDPFGDERLSRTTIGARVRASRSRLRANSAISLSAVLSRLQSAICPRDAERGGG